VKQEETTDIYQMTHCCSYHSECGWHKRIVFCESVDYRELLTDPLSFSI